jgi:hypothetical protein
MSFTPENAIADFKRKLKELWNIPEKIYYLSANGVHESLEHDPWTKESTIQVKVKGPGGKPEGISDDDEFWEDPREDEWVGGHHENEDALSEDSMSGSDKEGEEPNCDNSAFLIIDEERYLGRMDQTFMKALKTSPESIPSHHIQLPTGKVVEADDIIGKHLKPKMIVKLEWDSGGIVEDEENQEDEKPVVLILDGEELTGRGSQTFGEVLATVERKGDMVRFTDGLEVSLEETIGENLEPGARRDIEWKKTTDQSSEPESQEEEPVEDYSLGEGLTLEREDGVVCKAYTLQCFEHVLPLSRRRRGICPPLERQDSIRRRKDGRLPGTGVTEPTNSDGPLENEEKEENDDSGPSSSSSSFDSDNASEEPPSEKLMTQTSEAKKPAHIDEFDPRLARLRGLLIWKSWKPRLARPRSLHPWINQRPKIARLQSLRI